MDRNHPLKRTLPLRIVSLKAPCRRTPQPFIPSCSDSATPGPYLFVPVATIIGPPYTFGTLRSPTPHEIADERGALVFVPFFDAVHRIRHQAAISGTDMPARDRASRWPRRRSPFQPMQLADPLKDTRIWRSGNHWSAKICVPNGWQPSGRLALGRVVASEFS